MSNKKQSDLIPVTFLHPRGGKEFAADIGPDTTGQQAIDGMIKEKFIDPAGPKEAHTLQHTRTGKLIPLSASIVSSGVKENDTITILVVNSGAGR